MIELVKKSIDKTMQPDSVHKKTMGDCKFIIDIYHGQDFDISEAEKTYDDFFSILEQNNTIVFFHAQIKTKPFTMIDKTYSIVFKNGGYCD